MTGNLWILLAVGGAVVAVFVTLSLLADNYNLNNIKSRTVGDGQHGTARWATMRSSARPTPSSPSKCRTGGQAKICLKRRDWCWAASAASTASPHW